MIDGKQGISHDRVLMRLVNYTQIIGWLCGFLWGGYQVVRSFDRMEQQVGILQQQVSALQNMVVNSPRYRRYEPHPNEDQ